MRMSVQIALVLCEDCVKTIRAIPSPASRSGCRLDLPTDFGRETGLFRRLGPLFFFLPAQKKAILRG
jgi:hypothetical protein